MKSQVSLACNTRKLLILLFLHRKDLIIVTLTPGMSVIVILVAEALYGFCIFLTGLGSFKSESFIFISEYSADILTSESLII